MKNSLSWSKGGGGSFRQAHSNIGHMLQTSITACSVYLSITTCSIYLSIYNLDIEQAAGSTVQGFMRILLYKNITTHALQFKCWEENSLSRSEGRGWGNRQQVCTGFHGKKARELLLGVYRNKSRGAKKFKLKTFGFLDIRHRYKML